MRLKPFSLLSIFLGLTIGLSLSRLPKIPYILIALIFLILFINKKVTFFYLTSLGVGLLIGFVLLKNTNSNSTLNGVVIEVKTNYFIFQSKLCRYYIYSKDCPYQVGDILSISGNVGKTNFTTYESKFDFNEYLSTKGVNYLINSPKISSVYQFPFRFRNFELNFLSKFDDDTSSLLDSILFNNKNYESESIKNASAVGLLSICSTSGILFGVLLSSIEYVSTFKLSEEKAFKISTICGFLFLPFLLGKIGIVKTLILRVLRLLNNKEKSLTYIDLLSITGIILIIFDCYCVFQDSFFLSMGVSFVVYISSFTIKRFKPNIRNLMRYILVQLFMVPFSISYSNGIHLLTPVFSYILLPFIEIFTVLSVIAFLTIPIPFLINAFGSLLSKCLLLCSGTDLFIPIYLSNTFPYLYYLVFFTALFIREIGDLHVKNIFVGFTAFLYVLSYIPFFPMITQSVTFINVGQGDCCLIQDGLNTVMIDTGGSTKFDLAKECLIPYLYKNRIYKIDYLIETHGDFDHIGAEDSLMNNFNVKEVINSADKFPLSIGDIKLTNYNSYSSIDSNDSSLILGMEFLGKSWLFMGDASTQMEKKIISANPDLRCDILKAGHHGSDTSSSLSFLKSVQPREVIISVGASNSYGHPSSDVIRRFKYLNIAIRRTDEEGSIKYQKIKFL